MKIFNIMVKITTVLVVIFGFIACEEDFGSVGTNIIGENNFDIELNAEAEISAASYQLDAVQTSNFSSNLLGVYNDPVYGQKTASILTQLSLSSNSPNFGVEPVLDSVILTIPYYHRRTGTNSEGEGQYQLDSIFGSAPFKLRIMESNYFLNEYDPETNFEQRQKYYSDQQAEIENNLTGTILYETEAFVPSSSEIVITEEVEGETEPEITRLTPRLRIALPVDYFNEKILNNEGAAVLSNNNNFKNFIRGLYFKAEPLNGNGNMILLNFTGDDAGITLHYTHQVENNNTEDPDDLMDQQSTYDLNFDGVRFNTFNNNFAIPSDNNLYISGGAGAVTILDLFTDEQLEDFRTNDWLINEANLTFFVNQDVVTGDNKEPERIYIYNMETNAPLVDYYYDVASSANPVESRIGHLGKLARDSDGNGVSYKIRLTEHVKNVLNNDSTNVRLGLVVSQNVDIVGNATVKNNTEVDVVPSATVLSPKGTVLYGPNAANEEKKLKLRIYYTETESN